MDTSGDVEMHNYLGSELVQGFLNTTKFLLENQSSSQLNFNSVPIQSHQQTQQQNKQQEQQEQQNNEQQQQQQPKQQEQQQNNEQQHQQQSKQQEQQPNITKQESPITEAKSPSGNTPASDSKEVKSKDQTFFCTMLHPEISEIDNQLEVKTALNPTMATFYSGVAKIGFMANDTEKYNILNKIADGWKVTILPITTNKYKSRLCFLHTGKSKDIVEILSILLQKKALITALNIHNQRNQQKKTFEVVVNIFVDNQIDDKDPDIQAWNKKFPASGMKISEKTPDGWMTLIAKRIPAGSSQTFISLFKKNSIRNAIPKGHTGKFVIVQLDIEKNLGERLLKHGLSDGENDMNVVFEKPKTRTELKKEFEVRDKKRKEKTKNETTKQQQQQSTLQQNVIPSQQQQPTSQQQKQPQSTGKSEEENPQKKQKTIDAPSTLDSIPSKSWFNESEKDRDQRSSPANTRPQNKEPIENYKWIIATLASMVGKEDSQNYRSLSEQKIILEGNMKVKGYIMDQTNSKQKNDQQASSSTSGGTKQNGSGSDGSLKSSSQ